MNNLLNNIEYYLIINIQSWYHFKIMNNIDFNKILNREKHAKTVINWCKSFEENKKKLDIKRGLYVFGLSGIGKTEFVNNLFKTQNYDVIHYNAGDVRNKNVIETITKNYMSDTNIISMFKREKKKMIIVMDEIDGMNSGDKGGINTLIKLIRPKKTKKQKLEDTTSCPIICIGSYKIDKKIRELMKVCELIELERPTNNQIKNIICNIKPEINKNIVHLYHVLRAQFSLFPDFTLFQNLTFREIATRMREANVLK